MKKGQVTIFVILGMVLLLSVGLFAYYKAAIIPEPTLQQEQLSPVERFVSSCMEQALSEALSLLGRQGGFIEIPLSLSVDPGRYVSPDGQGIIKVPLWWYKGSRFSPSVESVQRDLERYTLREVGTCINGFQAFSEQYDITPLGEMDMTASLNRDDVSLLLEYPIDLVSRAEQSTTRIERFQASSPVRLRRLLEAANTILDTELQTNILENFTLDLMGANSDIPFTNMEFTCSEKEWSVQELRAELASMLRANLPRVRVQETNHPPFIADLSEYRKLEKLDMEDIAEGRIPQNTPEDAYEYLRMYWDLGLREDPALHVGFSLPGGVDLLAFPNENGKMRSHVLEGDDTISFFCISVYHFVYNVNYPVLVTLRDDVSSNGEGYLFSFALPVTLRSNEPFKENYGEILFTDLFTDQDFCDSRSPVLTDIRAKGKRDGYTNLELNDVNITLQCFRYQCDLGRTRADEGAYRLRANLPSACDNPFLIAEKEGYLPARVQATDPRNVEIGMTKIHTLPFSIITQRYNSFSNTLDNLEEPFTEDMQATVKLTQGEFVQVLLYPLPENRVQLIDDTVTYDLEITLVQGEDVVGGYRGTWSPRGVADAGAVKFQAFRYVPRPLSEGAKKDMTLYLVNGNYKNALAPELGR